MISMEPVLKRGYSSWDRAVLPEDEFALRVETVREALRSDGLSALVVLNHSLLGVMVDYADMAYLSGLQSGGLLLVPLDGAPAYVGFGGGRELAFMRTLTWIEHVVAGGAKAFEVLREQLRARGIDSGSLGLAGAANLSPVVAGRLTDALGGFGLHPYDARLAAIRRVKRPRELLATRLTLGIVEGAVAAGVAAFMAGGDNREVMLEAERVARARKARDVRILANMGGAELRPWEGRLEGRHAPLRLWVAAQYQGYWAEAAATAAAPAKTAASDCVAAMIDAAHAGVTAGEVAAAALAVLPADTHDSVLDYGLGGAIGLAQRDGLSLKLGSAERLIAGELLALRAHVSSGDSPSLASALISIGADAATRLPALHIGG